MEATKTRMVCDNQTYHISSFSREDGLDACPECGDAGKPFIYSPKNGEEFVTWIQRFLSDDEWSPDTLQEIALKLQQMKRGVIQSDNEHLKCEDCGSYGYMTACTDCGGHRLSED